MLVLKIPERQTHTQTQFKLILDVVLKNWFWGWGMILFCYVFNGGGVLPYLAVF
jgi:hypothetical protein